MDGGMLMDIDFDEVEAVQTSETAHGPHGDDVSQRPLSEIESDPNTPVLNKIHIAGLDTLSSSDVKAFVSEHYSAAPFERIDWINDTSANIIYQSESIAHDALVALSSVPIQDVSAIPAGEAIDAKPFSCKPEAILYVRFAVLSDRKVPGAAKYSRYYLLNPQDDPEERHRRREERLKYRSRDDLHDHRRKGEDVDYSFDASMYDDDEATLAGRTSTNYYHRRRQRSSSRDRRQQNPDNELILHDHNRDKELFPARLLSDRSRKRDRSLSPGRERHAETMADSELKSKDSASRNKVRAREIQARQRRKSHDGSRELFPGKLASSGKSQLDQVDEAVRHLATCSKSSELSIKGIASARGDDEAEVSIKGRAAKSATELFPDKFGGNSSKELFSDRLEGRGRPRRKAMDSFL